MRNTVNASFLASAAVAMLIGVGGCAHHHDDDDADQTGRMDTREHRDYDHRDSADHGDYHRDNSSDRNYHDSDHSGDRPSGIRHNDND